MPRPRQWQDPLINKYLLIQRVGYDGVVRCSQMDIDGNAGLSAKLSPLYAISAWWKQSFYGWLSTNVDDADEVARFIGERARDII